MSRGRRANGHPEIERFQQYSYYWDDLRFPANALRVGTAQPATEQAYKGGIVLSFASNQDNSVSFNAQMPHGLVMGLDLDFHVHITLPTSGAGAGAENVKFDMTYSWAGIGGSFPAETTLTATRDVQNDSADDHIFMDLGQVLYSNRGAGSDGVSDMLICSLTRDVSVANDYSSAVYLIEADFHIQINAPGSREETKK